MQKKFTALIAAAVLAVGAVTFHITALAEGSAIELPVIPVVSTPDSASSALDSDDNETEVDIPVHTHSFVVTESAEADCIHSGYKVYFCSCGETYTEDIPATGIHKYGSWKMQSAATCTADGSQYRKCSVCGKKETRTIKSTGHSYTESVSAPTYTEKGCTVHTCKKCGYSYSDCYTDKKTLAVPSVTSYSSSESAVRINWGKVKDASGYRVYFYDTSSKSWKSAATVGASSLTFRKSGLVTAGSYKFRVRAYVKENGSTAWSGYSAVCNSVTKPAKVKMLTPSVSSTSIRAKWKTTVCSGYQVYIYKNGAWTRIKTVSSSSADNYKITGLRRKTTYKIKVRSYMTDPSGKRVCGDFSPAVTVKTKA